MIRLFKLTKEERFIKWWEKQKQKGKHKYALVNGLVLGIAPVLGSIIGRIVNEYAFPSPEDYYYGQYVGILIIKVTIALIIGIWGSYSNWEMYEHRYKDLMSDN